ncbi:putative ATP-dependent RNA helicase DDX52 [Ditylenchus destructor]|nr:putative ATP-dependent RNA helicase DDX52 [Ditylenchus destructor]
MISSEISEAESDDTIDKFRKGELSMLICTELLGRGLDLPNVNLVINFDLPTSIVSYIHRIGRTGRAGRSGKAITYFTEADMSIIRPIATVVHQAGFKVADYLLRLNKVSKRQKAQLHKHAPKRKNVTHARNWRTINKKKKDPRRDRKRRVKNSSKVEEKPINDAE